MPVKRQDWQPGASLRKGFQKKIANKTKVISADLLEFYFDFEDIYIQIDEPKFGNKKMVRKKSLLKKYLV